ncbi:MAG: RAMP superfamily CRISPR-associated protein [Candidatus Syntrophoarchaeum sp.]|nr:RAMP superfamily CRISPR-associated protein [Candidatus Syntrophoarchaeum sp.]
MAVISLERFENKYIIEGKIRMETPLRIGKQVALYSLSSAPVLLQYDAGLDTYLPFIPGSSLKGVLRSTCERIVKTYGADIEWIDSIFGSQSMGSKVRVRDATCDYNQINERIHCATAFDAVPRIKQRDKCRDFCNTRNNCVVFDLSREFYKPVIGRRGQNPVPKTNLINEENIPPTTSFQLKIEVDNAEKRDIGLILLGLDEFNHRRAHIGGGVSRGYGFVTIEDTAVSCLPKLDFSLDFGMSRCEPAEIKKEAEDTLRRSNVTIQKNENDFSTYYISEEPGGGCIVCEFEVECLTEFRMKGVDEETVTVDGVPVIPGSTIKGALRHLCYYNPEIKGRGRKSWIEGCAEPVIKWGREQVDKIFGSQGKRSRILVSDVFFDEERGNYENFIGYNSRGSVNEIKKDARLKGWIVFDNMEKTEIEAIHNVLKRGLQITGKTSAKRNPKGKPERNRVKFNLKRAWKFTLDDFSKDVTEWFV